MTSSFESLVYRVNFLLRIDEAGGKLRERLRSLLCPQIQREKLESLFARNRRFGTTLRAIWQIQVLKLALIERGFDAGFQLVRELTLLQDRRKNRLATCDKIAEVSELLFDVTDLNLEEKLVYFRDLVARRETILATCDKIAEVSELLFDVTDLNLVEEKL